MEKWFLGFEEWLGGKYGFAFVVHFEDIILFAAGVFLGMLIMSVLSGLVVFKLQKVSNLGSNKINLVKFKHEGKKQYIADPKTVGESVETLLLVIFRPLFQTNDYTYRDEKRTKYFLIFLAIIGILLFALALICITTVVQDGR